MPPTSPENLPSVSALCAAYFDTNDGHLQTPHCRTQSKRAFYAGVRSAFEAIKEAAEIEPEERAIELLCLCEDELDAFEARMKAGQE